jgi:hypothetical protein
MAGEPEAGKPGRRLPKFEKPWRADFDAGHLLRIEMWKTLNREAEEKKKIQETELS